MYHVPEMPHSCRLKHFSYFDSDYFEYTNSRYRRRLKTKIEYCIRKYTIHNIIITLLLCARRVLTSHDLYEKISHTNIIIYPTRKNSINIILFFQILVGVFRDNYYAHGKCVNNIIIIIL